MANETLSALPLLSMLCQMVTASIAVLIGMVTYRYSRQQSALTLINHNNLLANMVNSTVIASPDARAAHGRFHDVIIGSPDDAVVLMYLNYVHNTFRMRRIGAVSAALWQDTLAACVCSMRKLPREQVVLFLGRGYEPGFRDALLAGLDAAGSAPSDNVLPLRRRAA